MSLCRPVAVFYMTSTSKQSVAPHHYSKRNNYDSMGRHTSTSIQFASDSSTPRLSHSLIRKPPTLTRIPEIPMSFHVSSHTASSGRPSIFASKGAMNPRCNLPYSVTPYSIPSHIIQYHTRKMFLLPCICTVELHNRFLGLCAER